MIRKLTSKKGISPILATLLLIAIAVAAAIISYAWIITFVSTRTEQSGAVLMPENVRYYSSGGANNRTDIVIRNTGTANDKVAAVYWSDTGYSALTKLTYGTDYTYTNSGIIRAEDSITITILWGSGGTTGGNWTSGETYYYKIVTESGNYLEFPEKAP